jgi:outer membrane protein assembly factor BamE (lipoprotein component of BamABCDE complex)
MKSVAIALSCAAFLLLSACATQIPWDGESKSLRLGMSQSAVQTVLGAPSRTWTDENGLLVWLYERSTSDGLDRSSRSEVIVSFLSGRVTNISQSASTTTTTTT